MSDDPFLVWPPKPATIQRLIIDGGLTYKSVAGIFGVSRQAVSGFCTRHNIKSGRMIFGRTKGYKANGCRWVDGDVAQHTHTWCGRAKPPAHQYCSEHRSRCVVNTGKLNRGGLPKLSDNTA